MGTTVETAGPQRSASGRGPAARAAIWTIIISAAFTVLAVAMALFPTPEEPTTENLPALSATPGESFIFVANIAVSVAVLYLVLYVCFRLLGGSRSPR